MFDENYIRKTVNKTPLQKKESDWGTVATDWTNAEQELKVGERTAVFLVLRNKLYL